jgi:hypothetical protein
MKGNAKKILTIMFMLMVVTAGHGTPSASAESRMPSEYQVKAAFLYNFAKFVEWPETALSSSMAPLNICILGKNPFNASLDDIRDKTVSGRPLSIRMNPDIEKLDQCHILFICASEKNQLSYIIQRLNNASVLTVADMEGFTSAGGMINLVMQDNKVSFDINLKSARLAGLKISSRLLKLANTVRE